MKKLVSSGDDHVYNSNNHEQEVSLQNDINTASTQASDHFYKPSQITGI